MDVTLKVNGEVVGQGRVPAAMSLHFTSNATFDIGIDLDSPVSPTTTTSTVCVQWSDRCDDDRLSQSTRGVRMDVHENPESRAAPMSLNRLGPFYRLQRRVGLLTDVDLAAGRRGLLFVGIAWLPACCSRLCRVLR